ncbi:cytochrome P450 [Cryphonectria parasitica EP155]|uniref:Cytochrome P450 n=1 Tax=Cryphonectria parasitica (strain ATCC 38755 / EP155) TaxID=660469 RepID=A0A9P4Y4T4_CRYP1|nr:cytochrome P450 [Cryphonectria parasitica EP155]KAF3766155.1 cytochrome P450 [Cryphonectria parasitica EP155]
MPPHSFWLGHLAIMGKTIMKYPPDLLSMIIPKLLADDYPEVVSQGLIYMDSWPFGYPIVAVFNPDMIAQFTQDVSLPKHPTMAMEFTPLTGCKDILNLEGKEWRMWRSIFNPGFSVKNLMALIPSFLEEIDVFRDWLLEVADSDQVVPLDDRASALATDVIGRATLGIRLDCQVRKNVLFETLKNQIKQLIVDGSPASILKQINPFRPFRIRKNNRVMQEFLGPLIQEAVIKHNNNQDSGSSAEKEEPKTIMSLAVKAYANEAQQTPAKGTTPQVDATFVDFAIAQFKIFILAGHDTTSSALSFAYHLLGKHPAALRAIRTEHDSVLGRDPSQARAALAANPQLLNQLPYTSAVIKESLRLFPPVATVRMGSDDFFLVHPETGQRFPTTEMMLLSCHIAAHRDPDFWPRPDEFVPERWLAREGDALHVRKNAFRPFELGPRGCIGQELAQLELRAILAMTIREFEIRSVYAENDPEWMGDKCYPCCVPGEFSTGHPRKSLPVRVTRRVCSPQEAEV